MVNKYIQNTSTETSQLRSPVRQFDSIKSMIHAPHPIPKSSWNPFIVEILVTATWFKMRRYFRSGGFRTHYLPVLGRTPRLRNCVASKPFLNIKKKYLSWLDLHSSREPPYPYFKCCLLLVRRLMHVKFMHGGYSEKNQVWFYLGLERVKCNFV